MATIVEIEVIVRAHIDDPDILADFYAAAR